jgi:LmbE family N-acetylglucosaminyl deacetylase
MTLIVDDAHVGTPADVWKSAAPVVHAAPLQLGRPRKVVLVAPHPDDEVLGAGGLIQELVADGIPLHVVAVTDGEASHPRSAVARDLDLPAVRSAEAQSALRRLGWLEPRMTRLGIPDGAVAENIDTLADALSDLLSPDDVCVAPWRRDGHPDHDACGEAAAITVDEVHAVGLSYLVWAWHWAHPEGPEIPWSTSRRFDLTPRRAARKRWATGAFRSQIRPLGAAPEDAAVLPAPVLRRHWQNYEIYLDSRAGNTW